MSSKAFWHNVQPLSFGFRHYLYQTRNLRTQPRDTSNQYNDNDSERLYHPGNAGLATPRELVQYLNQYIIGQENAKKVLSVAVFNHYNRVRANLGYLEPDEYGPVDPDSSDIGEQATISSARVQPLRRRPLFSLYRERPPLFEKSNVLVIGPTGSGKTLLARTLAKVLDVPFSVSDATAFTQAGYVGEDVDMAIQRLLQAANYDPLRASTGIVYIDEVDKIAKRTNSGTEGARDVGGEGVQQSLLRMLEGSVVTVQAKAGPSMEIPTAGGDPTSRGGQRSHLAMPKADIYHIDTANVLFILSGAFVGLDKIINKRVSKGSIGFTADLPFFTPNGKAGPENALDHVETSDLVQYGFIPEFISRLPSITTLTPLTVPDLRRILTEVRGSLVSQYQALFGHSGVEIRFTGAALDEICKKASERGGGARGLRGIMETLLLEAMYEVPGSDVVHVLITADTVRGTSPPGYWKKGQAVQFWEAWATEEASYSKVHKTST